MVYWDEVGRLAETLIAHGANADQINRLITLLNDYTTRQAIRLTLVERNPGYRLRLAELWQRRTAGGTDPTDRPGQRYRFCGRENPEIQRSDLLPLARQINEALARCGFTLSRQHHGK